MEYIIVFGNKCTVTMNRRTIKASEQFFSSGCYFGDNFTNIKIMTKAIIVCGCSIVNYFNTHLTQAEVMKEMLLKKGIPEEYIIIEGKSKNLVQMLNNSKRILDEKFTELTVIKPLIIITSSPYQLQRAKILSHLILGQDYKLKFITTIEDFNYEKLDREWLHLRDDLNVL